MTGGNLQIVLRFRASAHTGLTIANQNRNGHPSGRWHGIVALLIVHSFFVLGAFGFVSETNRKTCKNPNLPNRKNRDFISFTICKFLFFAVLPLFYVLDFCNKLFENWSVFLYFFIYFMLFQIHVETEGLSIWNKQITC